MTLVEKIDISIAQILKVALKTGLTGKLNLSVDSAQYSMEDFDFCILELKKKFPNAGFTFEIAEKLNVTLTLD